MEDGQRTTDHRLPVRSKRPRKTKRSVIFIDKFSTTIISLGGILVIIAVLGILIFLITVVVPLFRGARVISFTSYNLPLTDRELLFAEMDDYLSLGMALSRDGFLTTFQASTGKKMFEERIVPSDAEITAFSRTLRRGYVALGLSNGEVSLGNLSFKISFPTEEEVPEEFKNLSPGASVVFGKGILERAPEGQFRKIEEQIEFAPPVKVGTSQASVVLIDYRPLEGQIEELVTLQADGRLFLSRVTRKKNLLTGKVTTSLDRREIPYSESENQKSKTGELEPGLPIKLLVSGQGDQLYLAWKDGTLHRYDLRNPEKAVVVEKTNLIQWNTTNTQQRILTQLKFMIGDQSLISTDSAGNVIAWFRVEKGPQARGSDGYELVPAHILEKHHGPVSALAVSPRDKSLVTATSDGEVFLRHMTSEQVLARLSLPSKEEILTIQLTPKLDGIFAVDKSLTAYLWKIHNPHPETTWKSIFGKVWYEGYPKPTYTWQSSSGTDDFEPKLSLVPLIFGTLKATFYSLLFAVPVALLAAIYTSEFLDKKLKSILKPGIETMASLPSVVLGFIAALVLAPFVENWVLSILFAFGMLPLILLFWGYIWQLLPPQITIRLSGALQFIIILAVMIIGFNLAENLGVRVEKLIFHGDFKAWLDGRIGTGTPLWFILFFPFSILLVSLFKKRFLNRIIWERISYKNHLRAGLIEFMGALSVFIVSVFLSYGTGLLLTTLGWDARGELVGTYVQRNTLIVGFAMGFAVIPIIYTITEDALAAVPESLRAASLACGATRWQTAIRIVLPTAASGIFSAVMVGLGRAVGETMIVVMAAGNTPVLDLNIFNGLRALSANIAVELPEAVKDSTLYRMLFLAALLLFVMTFIVNTLAEIIRLRFRKKAYQL
ncbi:MAG TPA: ABC transporter permease subunit [Candidatus Limnocylindrales bacterium]|nr:ABC transporter permease subunit [Candidatus Limnocylindrales bacterium]